MGVCFVPLLGGHFCWSGFVSFGAEIMLSGPRLLLLALALGMCVLGLLWWIRWSCLAFVLFVFAPWFRFVVFLGLLCARGVYWHGGASLVVWCC